jgi:hypothetical protein
VLHHNGGGHSLISCGFAASAFETRGAVPCDSEESYILSCRYCSCCNSFCCHCWCCCSFFFFWLPFFLSLHSRRCLLILGVEAVVDQLIRNVRRKRGAGRTLAQGHSYHHHQQQHQRTLSLSALASPKHTHTSSQIHTQKAHIYSHSTETAEAETEEGGREGRQQRDTAALTQLSFFL